MFTKFEINIHTYVHVLCKLVHDFGTNAELIFYISTLFV